MMESLAALDFLCLVAVPVLAIIFVIQWIRKKPKKWFGISALICVAVIIGCTAVANSILQMQKEYNTLKSEYDSVVSELDALRIDLAEVKVSMNAKTVEYDELNAEYQALIDEAGPFFEMTEDEKAAEIARAEKERIEAEEAARLAQEEADRLTAEREAEAERQRQEEEAARLAEEAKGYETGITYKDLSRTPDDYKGRKVKFKGYVLQSVENLDGKNKITIRLATRGMYDDIIYATFDKSISDVRILEGDWITIYGIAKGIRTYETIGGGIASLPEVSIDRIEMK